MECSGGFRRRVFTISWPDGGTVERLRAFAAEKCVVCHVYAQWKTDDGTAYCTKHKPE